MRPIRLVVSAFGPYVEEQEIDFSVLRDQPLFLLTGPTGAGKTMLLDAICYALFGECSGEARKAPSVRSQHAGPQQPTRVEFEFALGAQVYRVERSPEQERLRRRGTGIIREPAKATLWRDSEVLETQPLRVTERITETLGFTSAQFRQVVVLPQGEFKRFLDAKSGEREDILEVLFQTGEYRRIEQALTARAAVVKQDWEVKRAERDLILRQAGVPSREALETAIQQSAETQGTKQTELSHLRAQAEAARAAVEKARDDDRRLKERRDAETAFDAVAAGAGANEARKRDLSLARSAARVAPVERDAVNRGREATRAAAELEAAGQDLKVAIAGDERARNALELEERRQPERDEAARDLQKLEALRGKVQELETARVDAASARQAAGAAAKIGHKAESGLNDCVRSLDAKRAGHDAAVQQAEPAARLGVERDRLTLLVRTRQALDIDQKKLAAAVEALGAAHDHRIAAESALSGAREKYRDAERRWIEGQAALLAEKLVEGQPCPVCGSSAHPAPAHAAEAVPGDAVLKRARAEVERLEKERDAAASGEHARSVDLAKAQAAIDEKRQSLGDSAAVPVQELARRLSAVQGDLAGAQAAAATAARTKAEIEQLIARERVLRQERDAADKNARDAAGVAAACDAVFKGREAEVPEAVRAPGALEIAIERERSEVAALERSLNVARDKAKTAGERLAGARNSEQARREAAGRAERMAGEARSAFDNTRVEAGFESVDDYRAALRSEDQIVSIERLIAKFQTDFAAANDRLTRARDQAEGIPQPDLPALETADKQARDRWETCLKEITALAGKIDSMRKQLDALDAVAAESERLEKRHRMVARIADAANGRNNVRVNFQRFVQATLLDRVLEAATQRLRTMSRGRFELQRTRETLDRRASAGLDLEVFDAHTGAARPVSTLSGGESFQASLALALGLAGVVQTHAGGLRLESIFIDEGFGSLDADALGLAMDTLRDLQQGGRLIGIVSHVAELKEQIPARLEVKPGRRGSEAKFVIN